MTINLPTPENNSGSNDWSDVYSNDKTLKEAVEELQTEVNSTAHPVTWYEPKIISTEQSTSSTSFTTLATADEITGVVVPTDGVIIVMYLAAWKSSLAAEGRVGIFIGDSQLKVEGVAQDVATKGTATNTVRTFGGGLVDTESANIGAGPEALMPAGGPCYIRGVSAGTYAVSIRYRAKDAGVTVSAQSRNLYVAVLGS